MVVNLLLGDILTCETNRKKYRYKTDNPYWDCRKIEPKIILINGIIRVDPFMYVYYIPLVIKDYYYL